jgi:anaerobic selenocysteine-containing dehydrogenase
MTFGELARPDIFAAGIELTMAESMTHCDVVLPAATNFEYAELYPSYGHHWLQRAEGVIPPVGESLPNTEIFRRLAARFGFEEPCFKATDEELMDDAVDAADPRLAGIRPRQILTRKALQMTGPDGNPLVLFDNISPATPSGKRSSSNPRHWPAMGRGGLTAKSHCGRMSSGHLALYPFRPRQLNLTMPPPGAFFSCLISPILLMASPLLARPW